MKAVRAKKGPKPTADMALAMGAKKLHERRLFMYEASKNYNSKFLDTKTGLCKKEYLEDRSCPVCGSDNHRELFVKGGGRYVICKKCQMIFLNPVFTDKALNDFYSGYPDTQARVTANEFDFGTMIYNKGLTAITKFKKKGTIMDVGCSSGMFLDVAKQKGWTTIGVELNKKEAAEAKKKHEVYIEQIQTLQLDKQCDVITMWDVLEHIKDGESTLRLFAEKYLNKGGLVFLQIPNAHGLAPRVMQEKSKMYDGIEHVNLYSPSTITMLAKKSGYKVAFMTTVISEIPVAANYLDYQDPYLGETKHNGKVFGLIDEKTIHKNHLGYKMQIVLQLK